MSAIRDAILARSPGVYLRLGDAVGSTAAADASGSGQNALAQGVAFGSPGLAVGDADTAASFDGVGSIVLGGQGSVVNYPFTLFARARLASASLDANPDDQVIVAINYDGGLECGWLGYYKSGGTIYLRGVAIGDPGSSTHQWLTAPAIDANAHSVAAVFASPGVIRVYLDGVEVAGFTSDSATPTLSGVNSVYVGGLRYNASAYYGRFNGVIDEAAIFAAALSPADLLAIHQAATVASTSSLLLRRRRAA